MLSLRNFRNPTPFSLDYYQKNKTSKKHVFFSLDIILNLSNYYTNSQNIYRFNSSIFKKEKKDDKKLNYKKLNLTENFKLLKENNNNYNNFLTNFSNRNNNKLNLKSLVLKTKRNNIKKFKAITNINSPNPSLLNLIKKDNKKINNLTYKVINQQNNEIKNENDFSIKIKKAVKGILKNNNKIFHKKLKLKLKMKKK
jgi:hypothetical protein